MWSKVISVIVALGFMWQRVAKRVDEFLGWFPKYLRRKHEADIDRIIDKHDSKSINKWMRHVIKKRNKRRDSS